MRLAQIVKVRPVAAAATVALLWCGTARAQVLEQVPADAAIVFKINNLDAVNKKAAKLAKDFGLDELHAEFKDPLSAVLDKGHVTKGFNRSGDMAIVGFAHETSGLAIVPVEDYKAFVGNFEKADGGEGDISAIKNPDKGDKVMYVASRGKYALITDKKELLQAKHAAGLKLPNLSQREAGDKDALIFVNIPALRTEALKQLHDHRQQGIEQLASMLGNDEKSKQWTPVVKVVANKVFDCAEQFMRETDGVVFSANLTDQGIVGSALVEFAPTSDFGKNVAQFHGTNQPLLAGLPDRKYFAFGGGIADPKLAGTIIDDFFNPVQKELVKAGDQGKQVSDVIDAAKTSMRSVKRFAIGYPVPQGALGNESVIQQIEVIEGDAQALRTSQAKVLEGFSQLMQLAPKENGQAKFEIKPDDKTVDGVKFDSYSMKMEMDPNDPRAAQMQQMMGMIYGPGGLGGVWGAVNDKTFLIAQGAPEKLLSDAVAAAKANTDTLSKSAGVQAVAAQLPKERVFEEYVALDNIVRSVVRYAQGFGLQVKMKIPDNLPPLAISAGTEQSAARFDLFVPSQTVQSLIAAGLDAYTQMQKNGGQGGL